jgi:hypothetical protein
MNSKNIFLTAAVAGLLVGATVHAQDNTAGSADGKPAAEQNSCKNHKKDKNNCKGHDAKAGKKAKAGDKCNGANGCDGSHKADKAGSAEPEKK